MGRAKEVWAAHQHYVATEMKHQPTAGPLIPLVSSWAFHSPSILSSGLKTVPVSYEQRPISLTIQDAYSPFEPSAFVEGNSRKTLTLNLTPEWDDAFECFEACLLHEVASRREEFFGRPLGEEEVREMCKPITKKTGDYPRNLRAKLNTAGLYAARYWAADKTRMDPPETLAGVTFNVRVSLRAIWIGDDAWGVVADCTDLQLADQPPEECPF